MPQTLLALCALVVAGVLGTAQHRALHRSADAVVRDQEELAVAGAALHAIAFAEGLAFDRATAPAALRARYGLPPVMARTARDTLTFDDLGDLGPADFTAPAAFGPGHGRGAPEGAPSKPTGRGGRDGGGQGGPVAAAAAAPCSVQPAAEVPGCGAVEDLDGYDRRADACAGWRPVRFDAAGRAPLEAEVCVRVDYVEAHAPDVPVGHRTAHKRLVVHARAPRDHAGPGAGVRPVTATLARVVAFDSPAAADRLRRSIAPA